jgi:glucose-6-phosphate 1-epimerase
MIVGVGGCTLTMTLRITNSGASAFAFDAALHTYLAVSDISSVQIVGLQGHQYLDSLTKLRQAEVPDVIRFKGEVDRGYFEVGEKALKLVEPDRTMTIRSKGFPDAVVWNPGEVTGSKIKDLELRGFRRFVCIEAAAIAQPVTLSPGRSWEGTQVLEAD